MSLSYSRTNVLSNAEEKSPPKNSLQPPRAVAVAPVKKSNQDNSNNRGVTLPRGGKTRRERVLPAEAIIKCQMCGREQKLVFRSGSPPEWHKCIWCGELQPLDGYRCIAYGLGLPQPLAPHEVKAREIELARLHEYKPIKEGGNE